MTGRMVDDMYKLIWPKVNEAEVLKQYEQFLNIKINNQWQLYKQIAAQHIKLGELKTLNTLEAFLFYFLMDRLRPNTLIEIGTLQGKSTRRLIDIRNSISKNTKIVCYDIVDKLHYIDKNEVTFNQINITGKILKVLDQYNDGIIYLDAHPYDLTSETILAVLQNKHWHLIIHDCGKHLYNPNMLIPKDRPDLITSLTGHWERHILSDIFRVNDPLSDDLNNTETATHKLKIFDTTHGICAITPK
jgi:predicted O-methyltransferase YrrM